MNPLLMLPGPTPLPQEVQAACQRPLLNHRSSAWEALFQKAEAGLKWAYQTDDDVLMFSGSGTTAMEAALVNVLSPGDAVLALVNGSFGHRFAQMAEAFGARVTRLEKDWGELIFAPEVEEALHTKGPFKAVIMVHSETSTGVLNPLEALAKLTQNTDTLLIVDAISSLTTVPIPVKKWGLDLVLSASQKSFMSPPGLSFVSVSPKAWEAHKSAKCARYQVDFKHTKEYALKHFNPWTPPVLVYYALDVALDLMQAEGLSQIQERHEQLRTTLRTGAQALGFTPWVQDERFASRSVTPLLPPKGVDADTLRLHLLNKYKVSLGSAQRKLAGQFFRVGHLGDQHLDTMHEVLRRIQLALEDLA